MLDDRVAELERANAELQRKLDERTAALKETLEQQTATAAVLQVINSSPGNLAPVFDAMLNKATNLCEAAFGILWTYDGERYYAVAFRNVPHPYAEFLRQPVIASRETPLGRIAAGETLAHIPDMAAEEIFGLGSALIRHSVELGRFRTVLGVAMRKEEILLGAFTIYRQEVRPFSESQIALLQNFAAQAVIAMENARLINETREALEQQTATAEVLQVINSSPGDLAPVFDAILEKAHTLCDTAHGSLQLWDGEKFRGVATRGFSETMIKAVQRGYTPGPNFPSRHIVEGERAVHCVDIVEFDDPIAREGVELSGSRTMLYAALRKDDVLLGQIVSARHEVRPFSEKQIALVENFAAQAVIAMENARLINETREALEQQTATVEVLQVINSSPGDLQPVFDAMLEKAMRLCEAAYGVLWTFEGERARLVASQGLAPEIAPLLRDRGEAGTHPLLLRIMRGERLIQIADVTAEDAYRSGNPIRRALADLGGARTGLWVALRKDALLLGAFVIYRKEVRPFSDKQIALLQNFAAQAVIAMENARLLNELQDRTRDLQESLEYQT